MCKSGHYIHVITKRLLLIGASLLTYGWLSGTPHRNPLILLNVSMDQRFWCFTERKINYFQNSLSKGLSFSSGMIKQRELFKQKLFTEWHQVPFSGN